jgi:hypothetical protein
MSDVIRDALIRIRYEVEKSKLEGPEFSQVAKAHEEVAKAQREVRGTTAALTKEIDVNAIGAQRAGESWTEYTARVQEAITAQSGMAEENKRVRTSFAETSAAHEEFARRSDVSWQTAGRGALQFTRGLALMATSSGETTQKMLENIVKIEAASQLVQGTANIAKFAAGFGPLGMGVAAVSALAAVGATVWDVYAGSEEKAAKATEKHRQEAAKLEEQLASQWERQNAREAQAMSDRFEGTKLGASFAPKTPEGKAAASAMEMEAIHRERANLEVDHRRRNRRFTPGQFGGDANEAFKSLLDFGSDSELTNELSYQTQKRGLIRSETELGQKTFEEERDSKISRARKLEAEQLANLHTQDQTMSWVQKGMRPVEQFQYERNREFVQQQIESVGMMAPLGASTAMRGFSIDKQREEPFRAQAQQDVDKAREITEAQHKFADAMIDAFNQATQRITALKNKLDNAHPN